MPRIRTPSAPQSGRIESAEDLGKIIRYTRMKSGLTVDEAAQSIGVAKATLLRVEQGKGGLQFHNLTKILQALGLSLTVVPTHSDRVQGPSWPTN